MELPKLWGKEKKKELWQLSCPNCWGGNKRKELWLAKTGENEKRIVTIFFLFLRRIMAIDSKNTPKLEGKEKGK